MNNLFESLKLLLKRTLLGLALFMTCRFLFLIFNPGHFTDFGIEVFIYGIRFDLAAFFYFFLPFVLFSIIGLWFESKWIHVVKEYTFYLGAAVVALLSCIDIPYFRFTGRRSTSELFNTVSTGDDVSTLIPQFLGDFWYIALVFVLLMVGVVKVYRSLKIVHPPEKLNRDLLIKKGITTVVVIAIFVLSGRGGFQLVPLSIIDASKKANPKNVPLVLNTPFTIIRTIGKESLKPVVYFPQPRVEKEIPLMKNIKGSHPELNSKNVVFIILESFSDQYIFPAPGDPNLCPNIRSLLGKSYVFDHCYANGTRSIEGIPAILSGIPSLMNDPFINSSYAGDDFESIASVLGKHGYHSSFYHGGKNGTMNFDGYCSAGGFNEYKGLNEYPHSADYDGAWGIPDEPYLQYYAEELKRLPQPFVSSVLSLSSHHPFIIPEAYKDVFNKGRTKFENTIMYADHAVGEFFKSLEGSPILENTIFVFTADHTSASVNKYYRNSLGSYRIPFFIYAPGDSLIGKDYSITQQIDIMPTVLDLLDLQDEVFSFGQSKFTEHTGFSVQHLSAVDQLIRNDHILQLRDTKPVAIYNIKTDSLLDNNLLNSPDYSFSNDRKFLMMFRQQYNYHLINNQLHKQ